GLSESGISIRRITSMAGQKLETRCLSSLSKVFSDEELMDSPVKTGSALWKETYSFQVAYKWGGDRPTNMFVEVASELSPFIQIRSVGLVPSEFPIYCDHDKYILRATPG